MYCQEDTTILMIYVISIDWLAIHCHWQGLKSDADAAPNGLASEWEPVTSDEQSLLGAYPWKFKLEEFGTRQFAQLWRVAIPNVEGGYDDFAEIQAKPHSGILNRTSVIVRFVNRALYTPDFWELAARLLSDQNFRFVGISRIDICGDFNQFKHCTPLQLIEDFAAKKLRHIGRGVGALYFDHGIMLDKITRTKEYGVRFTGLSFGTHASDVRVYLYNKSFELLTQGDKPWIRDRWRAAGLDERNVWRLEVSIKSKGMTFKDKQTDKKITIDLDAANSDEELTRFYHTFVQKKFAFIKNRRGITNVSREERIELFDLHPIYIHKCVRNISPYKRFEKMFLKALYQLGDLYRGGDIKDQSLLAQSLAFDIAASTDLSSWMADKIPTWEKPTHK